MTPIIDAVRLQGNFRRPAFNRTYFLATHITLMTETIRVETRRREATSNEPDAQRDLEKVERLAKLLDTEFEFAGIRFGLDAIIGLTPVLADSIAPPIVLHPIHS